MASSHRDDEKKSGHHRLESLVFILLAAGAFFGYGVAAANGWTENKVVGDMVTMLAVLLGTCGGALVYALVLFFLRR